MARSRPSQHVPAAASMPRRRFLTSAAGSAVGAGALTAFGAPWLSGTAAAATHPGLAAKIPSDAKVAADVKSQFLHAWNGYVKFAWGSDEVHPISGTASDFFVNGHSVGLSIIEALDTLYVMELDTQLTKGVNWITQNLNMNINGNVHVFEWIIRVVGGLLAGHLATGNATLLAQAKEAADHVMPAFTKSPTGMPYQFVNFVTNAVSGNTPPIAEIGTNVLEFGVLSQLLGDQSYFNAAKKASQQVVNMRSSLNLLGTYINIETGQWADSTDPAPNPPVDSFYEYLWGGHALFGDSDYLNWYNLLNGAMTSQLVETFNGLTWYKQVNFQTGAVLGRSQSELAAFYGEVLAHGGDVSLGESYYNSWVQVAKKYPVLPDEIDYTNLSATAVSNELRPEYLNAAFDLWVQTRKHVYKTTSYSYFKNMKTFNKCANGYTIINDVTQRPMPQGDYFPAYSFAENFKYLYLIFSNSPRYNYSTGYLSTEGKVLRGLQ